MKEPSNNPYFSKTTTVIFLSLLSIWTIISIIILVRNGKELSNQNQTISSLGVYNQSLLSQVQQLQEDKEKLEGTVKQLTADLSIFNYNQLRGTQSNTLGVDNGSSTITNSDAFLAAGSATVVYKKENCDYFILESRRGFVLAEWMGGNDPDTGDVIAGNLHSFGTKDFYNVSRKADSRLWIDDYDLSRDNALEKLSDKCN